MPKFSVVISVYNKEGFIGKQRLEVDQKVLVKQKAYDALKFLVEQML